MSKAPANVRAKMSCTSVDKTGEDTFAVRLSPVTTGSEENEKFYKYTPGGVVVLEVVSPEVAEYFEKGKEYYLDFKKV